MRPTVLAKAVLGYVPGIQKHYANATLHLDGADWTAAQLVSLFQELGAAVAAAAALEQQRADAVQAAAAVMAKAYPVAKAFKQAVLAAYGSQTVILGDFSLDPPKVAVTSPEVKAAAAKKAAATRKALGTMGPKQKKDAKKLLATQVATQPAASTEPAPAPAAPATGQAAPAKA
jgi:hypothetical protein